MYQRSLVDGRTGVEQTEGDAGRCSDSSRARVELDATEQQQHDEHGGRGATTAWTVDVTAGCERQAKVSCEVAQQRRHDRLLTSRAVMRDKLRARNQ